MVGRTRCGMLQYSVGSVAMAVKTQKDALKEVWRTPSDAMNSMER